MATADDVHKLAALARLRVDDAQAEALAKEFDAILGYVGKLDELHVDTAAAPEVPAVHNVMRDDREDGAKPNASREDLLNAFPEREEDSLVVKQIISYD